MNRQLFQRYLEESCSPEECRLVEEWLHTANNEEVDKLLKKYWDNTSSVMPGDMTRLLWQQLQAQVNVPSPPVINIRRKWWVRAAAAAVVIAMLTATAMLLFRPSRLNRQPVVQTAPLTLPEEKVQETYVVFENTARVRKVYRLEDGSTVNLLPGARIRFLKHFNKQRRDIELSGLALFTVAKDRSRPFTVYSRGVSTTALGTVFLVNALPANDYISVKLFHGKVVIKVLCRLPQDTGVVLLPGDRVRYDIASMKPFVTHGHVQRAPDQLTDTLSFSNTPLAEVFKKLAAQRQVTLHTTPMNLMPSTLQALLPIPTPYPWCCERLHK